TAAGGTGDGTGLGRATDHVEAAIDHRPGRAVHGHRQLWSLAPALVTSTYPLTAGFVVEGIVDHLTAGDDQGVLAGSGGKTTAAKADRRAGTPGLTDRVVDAHRGVLR